MREGRASHELRTVRMTRGYTDMTPGSVLIEMGRTRVLCTASVHEEIPRFLRDSGQGWVTAEYSMLPGSSPVRVPRSSQAGGRTKEIQRLIGRSLRAIVDMSALGEVTVRIDCDVLQADGGTRTASITGAWVALHDALAWAGEQGLLTGAPLTGHCAAVSVGLVAGEPRLDLEYVEDADADVDMNVVMTGDGKLIEVQGTAERGVFTRQQLDGLLDLAGSGIDQLVAEQRAVI